jgi:hypothetical protein
MLDLWSLVCGLGLEQLIVRDSWVWCLPLEEEIAYVSLLGVAILARISRNLPRQLLCV